MRLARAYDVGATVNIQEQALLVRVHNAPGSNVMNRYAIQGVRFDTDCKLLGHK